jgi:hypothetical protein
MNLADDNDNTDLPSAVPHPNPRGPAAPPMPRGFFGRMGAKILDWVWLGDSERWARRLPEGERQVLLAQVTRGRQKLESARLLWAHEQYVEGLRLAEESVVESLRAAEQAAPVMPPTGNGHFRSAVRPLWADVLAALGASQHEIEEAIAAAGGFIGSRPTWNGDLRPENRRYFRSAIRTSEAALEHLAPLVMAPRRIVISRWLRIAAVFGAVAAGAAATMSVRNAVDVRASGSFNETQYQAGKAVDDNPNTEWLLPSNTAGWIEVGFRPRTIKTVRLLNSRNPPHHDRASRDFRVEGYLEKRLVYSSKHTFATFEADPKWMIVPVTPMRIDTLRVAIDNHHKVGGGLAELSFD